MSDTMEITREKWQRWIDTLTEGEDCIVAQLNKAARRIDDIINMQTPAKWGTTEPGLKAFQYAYTSYWREEQAALRAMSKKAAEFASRVREALDRLDDGEEEAVAFLNQAAEKIPNLSLPNISTAPLKKDSEI